MDIPVNPKLGYLDSIPLKGIRREHIADGAIGPNQIATDAITSVHIAANAVGSSEIATNAIGSDELADNAVDTAAVQDNAIVKAKMADNSVGTAELEANSVTDGKIETDFIRGIVAQQSLTTDEAAAHTVSEASDMLLNNVPVVNGHMYAVILKAFYTLTAGASTCRWDVNLHVNGTLYDRFGVAEQSVTAVTKTDSICGIIFWTASATQSTDDFTVELLEASGTYSFQFRGQSVNPIRRTLTIIDLGVI